MIPGRAERPLAALGWVRAALAGVALLTALFLLLPVLTILPASLSDGLFLGFPPQGLSLRWYRAVLADPGWIEAAWRSLRLSAAGAAVALVTGTSAALALSRLRRGTRPLRATFMAPLIIPGVVYVLGFYSLLIHAGLDRAEWTIAAGQTTLAFPVVLVVMSSALAGIDPLVPRAARSLGAPWWQVVARVELPLVRRSLVAAFVVAFTLCFDEVVVALFLAPPSGDTIPAHIWSASQDSVGPDIAAVAVLVILGAFLLLGSTALVLRSRPERGDRR